MPYFGAGEFPNLSVKIVRESLGVSAMYSKLEVKLVIQFEQ